MTEQSTIDTRGEGVAGWGGSDSAAGRDTLGFEPYVEAVAGFLLHDRTRGPLSLSVEGDWGSGKTSFMEQLKGKLEEDGQGVKVVWFNAWRHDQGEEFWAAFAVTFIEELSRGLGFLGRWRAAARLVHERFNWRSGWLDVVRTLAGLVGWLGVMALAWHWWGQAGAGADVRLEGGWALVKGWGGAATGKLWVLLGLGGGAAFLRNGYQAVRAAREFVGNPLRYNLSRHVKKEDYAGRIGFVERFHKDFKKVVDAYAGQRKVVVFVDDLDRCEVPKAADLMQALNLMIGDDERLLFVIGMDRQKVAAGLAVKFKALLPYLSGEDGAGEDRNRGIRFGYEYIEKFIQLPFQVPAPRAGDLDTFIAEMGQGGEAADDRGDGAQAGQRGGGWRRRLRWDKRRSSKAEGQAVVEKGDATPGEALPALDEPSALADEAAREVQDAQDGTDAAPDSPQYDWRRFRLDDNRDSPTVPELVKMVAPALSMNPRRMTQYVNLFRLRARIASRTGLLNRLTPEGEAALDFEQLGKFVALELQWPLLVVALRTDPKLLTRLCYYAEGRVEEMDKEAAEGTRGIAAQWSNDQKLLDLLAWRAEEPRYSLKALDAEVMLQVAPNVSPPEDLERGDEEEEQGAGEVEVEPSEEEDDREEVPPAPPGEIPEIEMEPVKAGSFIMGDDESRHEDEKPQRKVYLDAYEIAKYPLTNRQYKAFLDANPRQRAPEDWQKRNYPADKADHPVVNISWDDATACAAWYSSATGKEYRLPTEAEWEKAARGDDGWKYPWGDEFDPQKANTEEGGVGDTSPVGSYPEGVSPHGCYDMAGNVWEWCADWFDSSYYEKGEDENPQGPQKGADRALRGGSWFGDHGHARCSFRLRTPPDGQSLGVGVRFSRTL